MPRKGKEPAGLRRWRLAHRKHRRVRRLKTRVVRYTARRRRGYKRKGRRGSKAIPIVQTAVLVYPSLNAFRTVGLNEGGLYKAIFDTTGVSVGNIAYSDWTKGIKMGAALLGLTLIGGKIASRTGANRMVKKLTGGVFKVA